MVLMRRNKFFSSLATLAFFATVHGQTSEGCYAADDSFTSLGSYQYQSEGYCDTQCKASNSAVFAMTAGDECLCGNSLPSGGTVSASLCNLTCSGYPEDICGGTGYYSVWLSGVGALAASGASSASAVTAASTTSTQKTPSTTAAATPSVIYITTAVVQQGVTVVQTVSATVASTSSSATSKASSAASSSSSTAAKSSGSGISSGAIAGIVVGVLILLAVSAGLAFFFYRRRKQDTDDFGGEYKRHIEPAGAGIAAPSPSHSSNPALDNRLDTSLAIRRNSSESLADNQDYSRKILRVMN